MEVSDELHVPAALPPGKEPPVPLNRRLGKPQNRSGRCGVKKNLLPLLESNPEPSNQYPLNISKINLNIIFIYM
jgi:hypothetical protein